MWRYLTSVSFFLIVIAFPAQANLVDKSLNAQQKSAEHDKARELAFISEERELSAKLDAMRAKKVALTGDVDQLNSKFSSNEAAITRLEERLRIESGSLGEINGTIRDAATFVLGKTNDSPASIGIGSAGKNLNDVAKSSELPNLPQLAQLWQGMINHLQASAVSAYYLCLCSMVMALFNPLMLFVLAMLLLQESMDLFTGNRNVALANIMHFSPKIAPLRKA
ncbi:hypothetical protein [Veronia pacifica]|uniref:hypothetical protein n=1 Tax=Veronia pacifica TaxID=1080227 RepID=UPI001FDF191C|nr:hypothetical protein [Veronia pacifica]